MKAVLNSMNKYVLFYFYLTHAEDKNYVQEAAVYKKMATHGAEDVAVYSRGPMSFLFTKTVEQNFVAHAMAYSACNLSTLFF